MILDKIAVNNLVGDYQIWTDFVEEFTLNGRVCSPFRNERKPSFGWFEHTSGTILYKDFGTGDIGDVYRYLQQLWEVSENQVLETICDYYSLPLVKRPNSFFDDTIINPVSSNIPDVVNRRLEQQERIKVKYRVQPLERIESTYFEQFGISELLLKQHNVYQCSKVWAIYGQVERLFYTYNPKNPCFVYAEDGGCKVYQPLTPNKGEKWRNNFPAGTIECYSLLPPCGDILVITSSRKDVMCLNSLDLDIHCIAPVSENSYSAILEKQEELNQRFKHIIVYTNNDEPGVNASIKLTKKTGWHYMNNPKGDPKDPSDYYKEYGAEKLKELIIEKLERCCNKQMIIEEDNSPPWHE